MARTSTIGPRGTWNRTSARAGAALLAASVASLLLAGCADAGEPEPGVPDDPTWRIDAAGRLDPQLAAEVEKIAEEYDGEAAIALALPGAETDDGPVEAGELSDVSAWSTSKVPVAIAALRENGYEDAAEAGDEDGDDTSNERDESGDGTEAGAASWVVDLIDPMISESDNDAAESAWLSMGGEAAAAKAVNEVLGDGGDARTQFDAWVPPGDVQWELSDQAAFGANLTCIDGAKPVVEAMGEIVDYQSYGLGEIDGARFKGGWGPDYDGGYLSRQFGVIPASGGGVIGVAIAARPGDGTDDTAREMLDDIAHALMERMPHGGDCETAPVTSKRTGEGTATSTSTSTSKSTSAPTSTSTSTRAR